MANSLTPKEEFLLNPVTEHNITDAAIATFETNLRHGVKVEVPFEPKQDLHGYDYPWPAGGGKNLVNPNGLTNERCNSAGNMYSSNTSVSTTFLPVVPGETYTASFNQTLYSIQLVQFDAEKTWIKNNSTSNKNSHTVQLESTTAYVRIVAILDNTSAMQVETFISTYHPQLELGSTATAYAPYSNICPIEGYTECEVEQGGKNLFPPASNGQDVPVFIPKGTPFTASMSIQSAGAYIRWRYADGTKESLNFVNTGTDAYGRRYRSFNGCTKDIVSAFFFKNGGGLSELQIELGTTSTSYEPYQGKSVPISWKHAEGTYEFSPVQEGSGDPSPENVRPIYPALTITRDDNTELTVYGGSITFNDDGTSSIESKYAIEDVKANVDLYKSLPTRADAVNYFSRNLSQNEYATAEMSNETNAKRIELLSNGLIANPWAADTNGVNTAWLLPDVSRIGSFGYNDYADWKAYVSSLSSCVIAYPLASSTTYTLSITETQRAIEALGDKVTTTIYGGTVAVNEDGSADVVCEDYYNLTITGNDVSLNTQRIATTLPYPAISIAKPYLYCDRYNLNNVEATATQPTVPAVFGISGNRIWFTPPTTESLAGTPEERLAVFQTYANANPIHIIAKKGTGTTTYHFPNIGQLKTFLGTNNIWSDIGNVNVKYLTQNSETGMEYRGDRALELRRRAMIADAPTIHTTTGSEETGGLVSFKSYIKAPVKKIEIPFGPKQNLHGYDRPWPGDSAGLLPVAEKATKTVNGTTIVSDSGSFLIQSSQMVSGTKIRFNLTRSFTVPSDTNNYKICFNGWASGATELYLTFVYDDGIEYSVSPLYGDDRVMSPVPSSMAGKTIVAIEFYAHSDIGSVNNRTISPQIVPIDVENGYYQGSNICPISGWTGCEIEQRVKHYFNDEIINGSFNADASYNAATNRLRSRHGIVLTTGNYTIDNNEGLDVAVWVFTTEGSYVSDESFIAWHSSPYQFTLTNTRLVRFCWRRSNNSDLTPSDISGVILYDHKTTLPIAFTDPSTGDPLTAYGGTVTLNEDGSADVASEWAKRKISELSGSPYVYGAMLRWDSISTLFPGNIYSGPYNSPNAISSMLKGVGDTPISGSDGYRGTFAFGRSIFWISDNTCSTAEEYRTKYAECEIVYKIITPIAYHFSNLEQLKIWLGENNFLCDISDDITVKYWNRGFSN